MQNHFLARCCFDEGGWLVQTLRSQHTFLWYLWGTPGILPRQNAPWSLDFWGVLSKGWVIYTYMYNFLHIYIHTYIWIFKYPECPGRPNLVSCWGWSFITFGTSSGRRLVPLKPESHGATMDVLSWWRDFAISSMGWLFEFRMIQNVHSPKLTFRLNPKSWVGGWFRGFFWSFRGDFHGQKRLVFKGVLPESTQNVPRLLRESSRVPGLSAFCIFKPPKKWPRATFSDLVARFCARLGLGRKMNSFLMDHWVISLT